MVFSGRDSREKGVGRLHYGSLTYADLGWKLQSEKQYEEDQVEVAAQSCWE